MHALYDLKLKAGRVVPMTYCNGDYVLFFEIPYFIFVFFFFYPLLLLYIRSSSSRFSPLRFCAPSRRSRKYTRHLIFLIVG